jgi:hypothetical protein
VDAASSLPCRIASPCCVRACVCVCVRACACACMLHTHVCVYVCMCVHVCLSRVLVKGLGLNLCRAVTSCVPRSPRCAAHPPHTWRPIWTADLSRGWSRDLEHSVAKKNLKSQCQSIFILDKATIELTFESFCNLGHGPRHGPCGACIRCD